MINIGLLYSNKKLIKQLKKYLKGRGFEWKTVYSVSIIVGPQVSGPTIIFGGFDFKEIHRETVEVVFPNGWEKSLPFWA